MIGRKKKKRMMQQLKHNLPSGVDERAAGSLSHPCHMRIINYAKSQFRLNDCARARFVQLSGRDA